MDNKKKFIIGFLLIFLFLLVFKIAIRKDYHIIIDAGHGGKDGGTIGVNGILEKDLNLEIASQLERKLKRRNFKVTMIRSDDSYYSPEDRVIIANSIEANILVSIHLNASENNLEAEGIEVLYYPIGDNDKKANILLESLIESTKGVSKGVTERPNLVLLRDTKIPSFIVELGFLSNAKEAELLSNKLYQRKLVRGIYKGILKVSNSN